MSQVVDAIRFDDSLGVLIGAIVEVLGAEVLKEGVVLRDATGRLSFVCARPKPAERDIVSAAGILKQRLGSYARPDRVLVFGDDPGAQRLLSDPDRLIIESAGRFCWVLDRRIVGSGWLAAPLVKQGRPPRIVFASLKGGVGRSTALAVAASDLAARGKNILVVDLDLEAPGLGELMVGDDRRPQFGVLDYLVEDGIGGIPEALLSSFLATSSLTVSSGGRVDVAPALGTRSSDAPHNILPKLARAMIEDVSDDGTVLSVGEQISTMIDRLASQESYDVILIDSRAGLAELAAPAILGLGAVVLLFGTAQQQTVTGYKALFSGLKLLAMRSAERGDPSDWRLMFKPVYAKASLEPSITARYAADVYDLFADNLYDPTLSDDPSESLVSFAPDDPDAPHTPLMIPFDPRFVDFDPFRDRDHLAKAFYEQTFRPFLDGLDRIIADFSQRTDR